ncbi:MAG: methionine synthase [Treponema sp.]|jgi:5-methyltetrahydrofolate--homocysteine methyltransferase|nr:methionine synthase [Treponema sp.]
MNTTEQLTALASQRILILDGAMGSLIQGYHLTEADFRGSRFASHETDLAGCNDLLCLTKPELISAIHHAYLEAGADIIETCSFNATAVSLADYGIGDLAYEISAAAASVARNAADRASTADKPRFVAGSMGPTAKSASISPDINDPGKRGISWDELEAAYYDNARGLVDGGADMLLIETIFDTLNAKAAIFAVSRLMEERGLALPLMISATISDAAGRLLSGQTLRAFCVSVLHAQPWSIGLNCSFGAERLKAYSKELAALVPCLTSVHPNAGMPNEFGAYDDSPESMTACLETYMQAGLVNILGGCCGTTPAHIAAMAVKARSYPPRAIPQIPRKTVFAGLEPLEVGPQGLMKIGERTNVSGSHQFLKLIQQEAFPQALRVARSMIAKGAHSINISMDDPLLDAKTSLTRFLTLALSDPDIARVPIMLDSSRWEVLETGLKLLQGKGLVNSLSLKDGEGEFLRKSRLARRYGAAVVVMLFDEHGQAATYERKIAVAKRAYDLLVQDGFPPEDIIFDGVVLTIATGLPEHDRYALDFIQACAWIHEHCPYAQVSGGIANLSFCFQGNEPVRNALHGVLLKHARDAGLSMAIVNPGTMIPYEELDPELRDAAEGAILCTKPDATETLLQVALASKGTPREKSSSETLASWRSWDTEAQVRHAMLSGIDDYIEGDVLLLRATYPRALDILEGPLMKGMQEVGDRFGAGQMFLPQVIRSARVLKKAVAALEPFMDQDAGPPEVTGSAKILLATVKGDVHDIGKNIVGVVLGCNGYEILDLGVMVPAEQIIETALREQAGVIGLSGLITPSLDEMIHTAKEMEKRGLTIPLLIGGATTNLAHTAMRIAPEYSGPVVYVPDASRSAETVRALLSETERPRFLESLESTYQAAAARHEALKAKRTLIPLEEARANKVHLPWSTLPPQPKTSGILECYDYPLRWVTPHIDWKGFLHAWDMTGAHSPGQNQGAQEKLLEDAQVLLDPIVAKGLLKLRGVVGLFPALSAGDDVLIYAPEDPKREIARFAFLRNQEHKRSGGSNPCLADFILPREHALHTAQGITDWIGLFVLSAGFGLDTLQAPYQEQEDAYGSLLLASLANSLAEAFAEELHFRVRQEWWAYAPKEERFSQEASTARGYVGLRPAFGYPICPDHGDKRIVCTLLQAQERCGFALTESAMLIPAASVCGMYLAHPSAYYFSLGSIGEDQVADWAIRKGISPEEARKRIGRI